MGIMDSAKGLLGGATEQVDSAVDAAADKVKEHTPDQADGAVDQGAEMAKDAIKDQLQ
jgi:MT0933-like antitoxin protein